MSTGLLPEPDCYIILAVLVAQSTTDNNCAKCRHDGLGLSDYSQNLTKLNGFKS